LRLVAKRSDAPEDMVFTYDPTGREFNQLVRDTGLAMHSQEVPRNIGYTDVFYMLQLYSMTAALRWKIVIEGQGFDLVRVVDSRLFIQAQPGGWYRFGSFVANKLHQLGAREQETLSVWRLLLLARPLSSNFALELPEDWGVTLAARSNVTVPPEVADAQRATSTNRQ